MSNEHVLRFELDDHDLYTSVFLCQYRSFFKRVWVAVKYVFGYKCKHGHWDCTMLRPEDADRLIGMLNDYKRLFGD